MADDAPKDTADSFDVVMIHGKTDDGAGAKVLRARPGRIDAGEMRPMQDGRPLGSGEIVSLQRRSDAPALFDVKVEHTLTEPAQASDPAARSSDKPAQVATRAYRESWERTFGRGSSAPN